VIDQPRRPVARLLLLLFWTLTTLLLLTSQPSKPFVLLEKGTADYWIILLLFLLSSVLVFFKPKQNAFVLPHLFLVLFIFVIRPRSGFFGRDGSLLILLTYIVLLVWFATRVRLQAKVLVASSLVALIVLNFAVTTHLRNERKAKGSELIDYGDVIGRDHPGGFLEANLNQEWFGEFPHSRIVTDRFGFRTTHTIAHPKETNTIRILFVGDSFVTGLRTDQSQTIGAVLEQTLKSALKDRKVEVLLAGQDNPASARRWMEKHAFEFQPDLILMGLTIGNDIAGTYLEKRNLSIDSGEIQPKALPEDAYETAAHRNFLIKFDRSLQQWDLYKLLRRILQPHGIYSWNQDYPGRVSVFDVSSGLSYFYKPSLPILEQSIADTMMELARMQELCRRNNVQFVVLLFPQRFQISEREWSAALFDYRLDRRVFDRNLPNNRFQKFFERKDISYIDPAIALRKFDGGAYFPQGDMHFNAAGQAVVGKYAADKLLWLLNRSL
jgi:hypothetical protein